jgi:hypothetical protein
MGQPGKRAPTVEICESDRNFEPLAMRPHVIGPYPFDPNLLAQGIPPDDRVTFQENIYGPLEGTPLPQGPAPAPGAPGPAPAEAVPPAAAAPTVPPVAPPGPVVAPSAFSPGNTGGPSVAIATYDPKTGQFATPDGGVYRQTNLVAPSGERSWEDLLPTA